MAGSATGHEAAASGSVLNRLDLLCPGTSKLEVDEQQRRLADSSQTARILPLSNKNSEMASPYYGQIIHRIATISTLLLGPSDFLALIFQPKYSVRNLWIRSHPSGW